MNENEVIPAKLRELRRSRGLTVNELADKMDENYQKVGRIERGKSNLTLDYLLKVTRALGAPIDSVLTSSAEKKEAEAAQAGPSILNTIILEVEKNEADLFSKGRSDQKAAFISKLYEMVQNVPASHQKNLVLSAIELGKTFTGT